MVPICLLIEAIAVEICSRYIVNKWVEFTAVDIAKPGMASRSAKRQSPA
jgi:hypothetical protein